ncbi:MAG: hypothetical protein LQ350_007414, partial [Teloschistes chrysophthalmus]
GIGILSAVAGGASSWRARTELWSGGEGGWGREGKGKDNGEGEGEGEEDVRGTEVVLVEEMIVWSGGLSGGRRSSAAGFVVEV